VNETLPYCIFSTQDRGPRVGAGVQNGIIDLEGLAERNLFRDIFPDAKTIFDAPELNRFLECGRPAWTSVRERLLQLVNSADERLDEVIVPEGAARLHLPIHVGDYVDFYSSIEHASNVGKLFRPGGDPLTPNYRSMPIGYHGRSSTITIDEYVRRPSGQRKDPNSSAPSFGPSRQLDFELEVGFVVGIAHRDGTPISADAADEYLFGIVLLNDWSARDLQAWEGQPLGPFLSKSFATTISPWIVTLDALEPYRVANRTQDPPPLPYLRVERQWAFDIELSVALQTARMSAERVDPETIVRVNFRNMYWNAAQQLAHLTSNGSIVRAGDLLGSGTVSGTDPGTFGSLLEATQRGAHPLVLANGERRTFLEDGDTIVMRGVAGRTGLPRVALGELRGTLLPAQGGAPGHLE
jgi:fumarylacetoacetase